MKTFTRTEKIVDNRLTNSLPCTEVTLTLSDEIFPLRYVTKPALNRKLRELKACGYVEAS